MLATSAPHSKWFASCLNPPATTPPSLPSLFPSLSLPFSINHQNLKLYVFEKKKKKRHPFAFSLLKGIRKSYKMLLGSLSTSITPPSIHPPSPLPPSISISILRPASRHLSVSWSRCSHIWLGRLPFSRTDVAPVKHHIRGAGGLRRQIISMEEFLERTLVFVNHASPWWWLAKRLVGT